MAVIQSLHAQNILNTKKKFSILQDNKEILLSISTSPAKSTQTYQTKTSTSQANNVTISSQTASITPTEQAGKELLNFLEQKKILFYSKERWLKMRERIEGTGEYQPGGVSVSTAPKAAPAPLPPGLTVELPYESQLSITGRKTIGVAVKATIYEKPDPIKRISSSSIDMNQELQVRIKGRVGRKINVNVDFDDTSADKRDISVVYKGDPKEFVQEAAFGDISMSLPSTEFVGYSRQLFGIKLLTKYKSWNSWNFFSRTKGDSEVKRFTGNTQLVRQSIADTSYIPFKYYLIKFGDDKIKNGTVKVYRDDRIASNNNINTSTNTVVETKIDSLTTINQTYTGDFDLLVAGQDYTIDYDRGIVIFRNSLPSNHVVAVDYQRQGDGSFLRDDDGRLKIVKDESNTNGITRELKTFYNLGNVKIIRDDSRGNFILKVQDLNGDIPKAIEGGKKVPLYSTVSNSDITVDFESGVFFFEPPDQKPFHNELYTTAKHLYNIFVEYRYRVKIISLGRFGIVPQSERITMDGKVIVRDADYYIDYDAGIVTLFNEEKINESTVIEISYDYAPFGTAGGSTLVGTRSELSLTKNIFVGGTFIYNFAANTVKLPDIRTTPTSLMVWESDSRIKDIKLPFTPMKLSIGGEYAQSKNNPNTMDKAVIESMESIKLEDSVSLFNESWKPGSNPDGSKYYLNDITWGSAMISKRDINTSLDQNNQEKQQVLVIDYSLDPLRQTELSIVQPISNVGVDYSKKLFLETWILGDAKGEELLISYGSFNERVDSDVNTLPKTEDKNQDGTLGTGEDIGWFFINPDGKKETVNIKAKLDTEDLDGDGVLKTADTIASPGPFGLGQGKQLIDNNGVAYSAVTWSGWKYFKVPLNITNFDDWKGIKQVRITLRNSGAGTKAGHIEIGNISLISNRWEISGNTVAGSTIAISAINNEENPDYASLRTYPDYQSLYDMQSTDSLTAREQALSVRYNVYKATTAELGTRLLFGRAYDLSNYKYFKFFVYNKNADGDTIFLQVGNDTNYFEYSVPVNWAGWKLITIQQADINGDNKPEKWLADATPGAKTKITGNPNLLNISQLRVGVRAKGPDKSGEVWFNEIHVSEAWKKEGNAWRLNTDLDWPGWISMGGKRKSIDRSFQTFSADVYNRDYLEDSGYFNLVRIPFLPINTNLTKTRTITPAVAQNQPGDLVSILQEGRVISYTGSASANPNLQLFFSPVTKYIPVMRKLIPTIGGSYSRSITDSNQIKRLEDKDTLSGNLSYEFPLKFDNFMPFKTGLNIFPGNISGNYSVTNSFFKVYPSTSITDSDSFLSLDTLNKYLEISNYSTLEITEAWRANAPFQFWKNFTFSPSYSLSKVKAKDKAFDSSHEQYPKAASQNVAASSSLRIFSWLNPAFSYNITTNENYNLYYSTVNPFKIIYPSQTKYIDRNSNAEVSWNFQVKDVVKTKYFESLGFAASYKQFDNDIYENVESSYSVIGIFDSKRLWIRENLLKPLNPGNTTFYRIKSITKRDDRRLSGNYKPFEAFPITGRFSPFKTLSTNFTYTDSLQNTYTTGTQQDVLTVLWPDLNIGLNKWEKLVWLERWLDDSSLNLRHQKKYSTTSSVSQNNTLTYGSDIRFRLKKRLELSLGGNYSNTKDEDLTKIVPIVTNKGDNTSLYTQTGFNIKVWRFTVRYDYAKNFGEDGAGKITADLITHAGTVQTNADMSFPHGLPLPFTKRTLPLTNRLIFSSNLKYISKISSINIGTDNTDQYSLSSTGDYEISQNFRAALGFGYSYLMNRSDSDQNFHALEASAKLTIQF